jgi:hypothetical protein
MDPTQNHKIHQVVFVDRGRRTGGVGAPLLVGLELVEEVLEDRLLERHRHGRHQRPVREVHLAQTRLWGTKPRQTKGRHR